MIVQKSVIFCLAHDERDDDKAHPKSPATSSSGHQVVLRHFKVCTFTLKDVRIARRDILVRHFTVEKNWFKLLMFKQ